MKKLNISDIDKLLLGNSWYATGGGFPIQRARNIFSSILTKKILILRTLDEFKDEDYLCVASGVGSVKHTNVDITKKSTLGIRMLEKMTEHKIKGIVSGEIGLECLAAETATKLSLPLVDTDMKGGRAAPEPPINMFSLNGKSLTPMVAINTDGDITTLEGVSNPSKTEFFLRNFANLASGCFVAWCPRKAIDYKKNLVRGTISRAIRLGELIKAKTNVDEILRTVSGKNIFSGFITSIIEKEMKGFLIRKIKIKNGKDIAQVWVKNENLVVTVDQEVVVTCPDLITLINSKNNIGIHNSNLNINDAVTIIALPHSKKWHSAQGYELFSPKHFNLPFNVKKI
ncbi:hypothetical protein COW57_04080 [Candidatus Roizmanbacteria bacterium CG17_big_fil_post_rev_8_21_14_2_50_39_7]|uniref:DUF917 domain-containing protein n=2 Tax=Candidatus Roizmaniibacteriota TaxID=1752723 RepID=A0A2H0KJ93_9BACT|nr:MAG: hypothetical protein COV87_04030 [Candidatus Roizmanbacteria bacterium CG11_big_fil_rev_8_21_14_0_20_37_16]PIV70655.1 MAG: hypothetical protein COW57_04080 [Candidatus Roizmanbacteria bacterium CG17_big_fil_post_rev_8_21_14_2_50_39_7]